MPNPVLTNVGIKEGSDGQLSEIVIKQSARDKEIRGDLANRMAHLLSSFCYKEA